MEAKLMATVTITEEYEADSMGYGSAESIHDMIDIDKRNFERNPHHFIDCMLENKRIKTTIQIKRVK